MDNTKVEEIPIEVKIFKNSVQIIEPKFDQSKSPMRTVKTVKLEDFIRAFSTAENNTASPILPPCCVRYKEKGNQTILMLLHEEATFNATCSRKSYPNCIRPNVLMVYTLNKTDAGYTIAGTQAYGVKDSVNLITPKTRLYGLPFPNIGTNGYVCWGGNSISGTFKSLVGLKAYIDRVFNSPFNSDLFNSSSLRPFGIYSNHDLFQFLQDKDHFPYEILENLGADKTLDSI